MICGRVWDAVVVIDLNALTEPELRRVVCLSGRHRIRKDTLGGAYATEPCRDLYACIACGSIAQGLLNHRDGKPLWLSPEGRSLEPAR